LRTRLAAVHPCGMPEAEGPRSSPPEREADFAPAEEEPVTAPSILGYVLMVVGVGGLAITRLLFSASPVVIALQGAAVVLSLLAIGLRALVAAGALARMVLEERVLVTRYPEYAAYAARTKRMVPFVF
jgi:protein-S-isoprenylcysteine O-methyltransferase Ste14